MNFSDTFFESLLSKTEIIVLTKWCLSNAVRLNAKRGGALYEYRREAEKGNALSVYAIST
mgnify:CR=1 FL=1